MKVTEEAQLLSGNGTGQNLNGLVPQATSYAGGATGDSPIDTIRRAIHQVRLSEHTANGIVVHPDFLLEIDLIKDSEERYLLGSPIHGNQPRLWGLPVIATTAMASNEFLVGAFGSAAAIFDRQEAVIELSTEHADNFAKNMVSIRCEERIGMAVFQPEAFVTGSF
ncbi:phage major capsid protein [Mesorhizobium sp. J18]|uniref:phage major capsid protein n=1 Tax=Mesorhizobium sp. J18 TaxID=935263 RepID=UPI0016463440|nr:phage major capsid protein [Mesorhizobium sp. J18]